MADKCNKKESKLICPDWENMKWGDFDNEVSLSTKTHCIKHNIFISVRNIVSTMDFASHGVIQNVCLLKFGEQYHEQW